MFYFANFAEEISLMERCDWLLGQCLQTSNKASTMLAFKSLFPMWKCLLSKENFWNFYFETEFRNKFLMWMGLTLTANKTNVLEWWSGYEKLKTSRLLFTIKQRTCCTSRVSEIEFKQKMTSHQQLVHVSQMSALKLIPVGLTTKFGFCTVARLKVHRGQIGSQFTPTVATHVDKRDRVESGGVNWSFIG